MNRRLFSRSGLAALVAVPAITAGAPLETRVHRLLIHVGGSSVSEMNVALSNILNAAASYAALAGSVAIELVANGPVYAMLRDDVSPVKLRLAEVHRKLPAVVFSACQNSRAAAASAEGKTIEQIVQMPEATDVPAGVVRLFELQEQGWSYIRA